MMSKSSVHCWFQIQLWRSRMLLFGHGVCGERRYAQLVLQGWSIERIICVPNMWWFIFISFFGAYLLKIINLVQTCPFQSTEESFVLIGAIWGDSILLKYFLESNIYIRNRLYIAIWNQKMCLLVLMAIWNLQTSGDPLIFSIFIISDTHSVIVIQNHSFATKKNSEST